MMDDYPTPQWLKQHFDDWFDPCPLGGSGGLEIEWKDRTYCNMPYSEPEKWCQKAIEESRKGKRIVLLTRVDPSTKWWLCLVSAGFRAAFFHGRIKFKDGNSSPNFASAIWFSGEVK
jgi:hypothetical protein